MPITTSRTPRGHKQGPKGYATRHQILEAACRLFSERGFEGTGIRDIEEAAGVQRGLVTYHLGSKEDAWKAAVTHTFGPYVEQLEKQRPLLLSMEPRERMRALVRGFVLLSAEKPYINQLMIQESLAKTWRVDWLIGQYVAPLRNLLLECLGNDDEGHAMFSDPHRYYAILGACVHVFSLPAEVRALFGVDPFNPAFVEEHARHVLFLLESTLREETLP